VSSLSFACASCKICAAPFESVGADALTVAAGAAPDAAESCAVAVATAAAAVTVTIKAVTTLCQLFVFINHHFV
jgi:hypothetical protein